MIGLVRVRQGAAAPVEIMYDSVGAAHYCLESHCPLGHCPKVQCTLLGRYSQAQHARDCDQLSQCQRARSAGHNRMLRYLKPPARLGYDAYGIPRADGWRDVDKDPGIPPDKLKEFLTSLLPS